MSEKVKGVLVRLGDALGGLPQIREFIAKEFKALEDEVEELLGVKPEDNSLPAAAGTVESAPETGEGVGGTNQTATSAPSEDQPAPAPEPAKDAE